ncbi:MAG: MerR family transcriptional regulator [Actinomycetota bacterium]
MITVAKVARKAQVPPDTVRYYDRKGMLGPTERTPAGYRSYSEDVVDRLSFIRKAQKCGLRLREIAELLEIRDKGLCPCGRTVALLESRIGEAGEEIRRLKELKGELRSMIESVASKNEWCYLEEAKRIPERRKQDGKKKG